MKTARFFLAFFCALLVLLRVPFWWCSRTVPALLEAEASLQEAQLRTIERRIARMANTHFGQHDPTYEGEWLLVAYLASSLAVGHLAQSNPSLRPRAIPLLRSIADGLLSPRVRAFDAQKWNEDPLDGLQGPRAHLSWVGYANVAFSVLRRFDPQGPHAARNDALTAHLLQHYRASTSGLLLTYPDTLFPADNAVAIASIGLHERATGTSHRAVVQAFSNALRTRYRDRASGLLYQRLHTETNEPIDTPRTSGTVYSAWFLSYADPVMARELWNASSAMFRSTAGFGAMQEHLDGSWRSDLDSGPVPFGVGVSPTGFAIACTRIYQEHERFRALYATAHLFGMPTTYEGGPTFVAGGALGDALLLAAITARGDL